MTRLELTGRTRHEVREAYDHIPDRCAGCDRSLAAPGISLGTRACPVHGPTRTFLCHTCWHEHVNCDCPAADAPSLGTGYFRGQYGPTLDVGEG